MRRAAFVVIGAFAFSGCATLIGASFDDAGLVEHDAAADVHETSLHFDVVDATPFDPTALPNLAFWLDAHRGIDVADASNAVLAWKDQSGHIGRDAVPYPTYNSPTLTANAINGQPAVHFQAAAYDILATNWLGPGSTEFTFFVVTQGYPQSVLRFQTAVNTLPFVIFPLDFAAMPTNPNFGVEVCNTATDYGQARVTIYSGPTIAAAIWHATGSVATYTNGNLVEQRLTTTMVPATTRLFVGGIPYPAATVFTNGDVGEVIIYDSALSDVDRAKVEAYLSTKWGIGL